jgi:hypothetical protein
MFIYTAPPPPRLNEAISVPAKESTICKHRSLSQVMCWCNIRLLIYMRSLTGKRTSIQRKHTWIRNWEIVDWYMSGAALGGGWGVVCRYIDCWLKADACPSPWDRPYGGNCENCDLACPPRTWKREDKPSSVTFWGSHSSVYVQYYLLGRDTV